MTAPPEELVPYKWVGRHFRRHSVVWGSAVGLLTAALLAVLAWQGVVSYRSVGVLAHSGLHLHAQVIESTIERAIQTGERSLAELRLRAVEQKEPVQALRLLQTAVFSSPLIAEIALYDREGRQVLRAGSELRGVLDADAPPSWAVSVVSGSVENGYGTYKGMLGLARHLDVAHTDADQGSVALVLLFKPFEALQNNRLSADQNIGAVLLVDPDGRVLQGFAEGKNVSGVLMKKIPLVADLEALGFEAQGLRFVDTDQWLRLIKQLEAHPFRLIVAEEQEKAFHQWKEDVWVIVILAVIALVVVGCLSLLWRAEQGAEQRETERRLDAEYKLQQKTIVLQRLNEELEQLAIAATHDLQEPLRVMTLHGQLLQRAVAPHVGAELGSLGFVMHAAEDMRAKVDAMRRYLNAGVAPPAEGWPPLSMALVMQDVLAGLRLQIQGQEAVVEFGELPMVRIGQDDLETLLYQMIRNALVFLPEDRPARVKVTATCDDPEYPGFAVISICDNGLGVAKAYHEQIFKLFRRLHGKEHYPGVGAGLAICRRIVEHAGGRIWLARSNDGEGSEFIFTLPLGGNSPV